MRQALKMTCAVTFGICSDSQLLITPSRRHLNEGVVTKHSLSLSTPTNTFLNNIASIGFALSMHLDSHKLMTLQS